MNEAQPASAFKFRNYVVCTASQTSRGGVFEPMLDYRQGLLLSTLIERRLSASYENGVVRREEIEKAILNNVTLTPNSVHQLVSGLRQVLGDREKKSVIETVPNIGYRLGRYVTITPAAGVATSKYVAINDRLASASEPRAVSVTKPAHSASPVAVRRTNLLAELRERFPDSFYRFANSCADALCIEGVGTQRFATSRIEVSVIEQPYAPSAILFEDRLQNEDRVIRAWRAKGFDVHPGDCVGLKYCEAGVRDTREEIYLSLRIQRLTWFDYMFANQRVGDPAFAELFEKQRDVRDFVDLDQIAENGDVSGSELTNICPVYVTPTTIDGFIMYAKRSDKGVGVVPGLMISAVSENMNPILDESFDKNLPLGPFRTAARGLAKELSERLRPPDPGNNLHFIGIGYDLMEYHPCLLFHAPMPFSRAEVEQICKKDLAEERRERKGLPRFAHLDDEFALDQMLSDGEWFPSGMASVIRTLDYLARLATERHLTRAQMAKMLASESDWDRNAAGLGAARL